MSKLSHLLKELEKTDKKSLMGIGKYDSDAEKEFNRHHGGSMYGDHMGNIADKDTIDFDDEETDRNSGTIEPYEPKKDKIKRGYEPVNLAKLKEMKLINLLPSNLTTTLVLTKEELEEQSPCWKGYKQIGMKDKNGRQVPNCVPIDENESDNCPNCGKPMQQCECGMYEGGDNDYDELDVEPEEIDDFIDFLKAYKNTLNENGCPCVFEAEYQGREVKLGHPMQGDVKKFKVYVKNPAGKVVKVNFGQKGMKIRKSNPAARKSFRARMNCDNPGPRTKANYWSCRKW
jgi:hypothetical protein